MATDLMIDIESLGTGQFPVILSWAAVRFDRFADNRPQELGIPNLDGLKVWYNLIAPESCDELKMEIDESTIKWWANQNQEVIDDTFSEEGRIHIKEDRKSVV